MTAARDRFWSVVLAIHYQGHVPTPTRILYGLGHTYESMPRATGGPLMNGRQTRWRREMLLELGYRKHPHTGRWLRPEHEFSRDLREYEESHREVAG